MKVGQLIKILQAVNPDKNVTITLGDNDRYRNMCAKAELLEGECLYYLTIDKVEIGKEDDELYVDLIAMQENYSDETLNETADEFDKKYPELKFK